MSGSVTVVKNHGLLHEPKQKEPHFPGKECKEKQLQLRFKKLKQNLSRMCT